jgi:2'-5' RNA ligase
MPAFERARVFFALWPDDAVRDALADAARRVEAECDGRATAAAKIHLTLFFVGEIERSRISRLEACASALAAEPFGLETDVLGYWRHNRIVWAGTRATPAALSRLIGDLTSALAAEGYRGEDRPYVPHVTLVRNARRAPGQSALQVPAWSARELALVESAAGRYEVLRKWAFERHR